MSTGILAFMDNNDIRRAQHLERLERRRQVMNERLEKHRERINERFDKKQAKLSGKMTIKQEQIIAAALELLDEKGLSNLSLRDIAKALNMQAPALYWYFKNKEDLVDYMAEAILQKEFHDLQERRDDQSWQDWLIQHMTQLRRAMLAYTDGARVVAGAHIYPTVTLAKSFEYSMSSLTSAGIDLPTSRHIVATATHYTFGHVIEEQSSPNEEQLANIDVDDLLDNYPHIAEITRHLDRSPETATKEFIIGIGYIIKGSS